MVQPGFDSPAGHARTRNTENGGTMSQVTMTPLAEIDETDLCICGNPGDVECRKPLDNGEEAVWVSCTVCLEDSVTEALSDQPRYQIGDILKIDGEGVGMVTNVTPMRHPVHGETFVYEASRGFLYWQHEVD